MCPPDACVAHFEAYHLWRDLSYRFRHTLSLFLWDLWSQSWYMAAFVSRLALRAVRVHPASKRVLQSRSQTPSWDFFEFCLFIYSLLQWFPSNSCTEGDLRTPALEKSLLWRRGTGVFVSTPIYIRIYIMHVYIYMSEVVNCPCVKNWNTAIT